MGWRQVQKYSIDWFLGNLLSKQESLAEDIPVSNSDAVW